MGVGKYTPNLSLYGDMGWMPCSVKQWSSVFRLWSRFCKMDNNRLNKKVFIWSNMNGNNKVKNWCFRIMTKFKDINLDQYCDYSVILSKSVIKEIEFMACNLFKDNWYNDLVSNKYSKLRTYKLFKTDFKVENYICKNIPDTEVPSQNFVAESHL